jgi:Dihydrofolate reductase
MRKVIAAINMTVDGVFDHTAMLPDQEVHQHYADLLDSADAILYGRITYHLMEYWREILKNPTGYKATDEFAISMDKITKIVFSNKLKNLDWESARLSNKDLKQEVFELKQQQGKNILVGSRSLIISLLKLNLIDEFQLCIHPVIAGGGLQLFNEINDRLELKMLRMKTFGGGAVILYYVPIKRQGINTNKN